jgi:hypothetical protein
MAAISARRCAFASALPAPGLTAACTRLVTSSNETSTSAVMSGHLISWSSVAA